MKTINSLLAAGVIALSAAAVFAQKDLAIAAVQGDRNVSPVERESVRVSGIVTARTRTGFFIQTPDDKADANPNSSEGVFVYTRTEPAAEAAVGSLVTVTGPVEEFRPRSEPASLPVTEISMQSGKDTLAVVSKDNPLPKPVVLAAADFKPNSIDELEKYEGMRVQIAEFVVSGPTDGRVDIKNAKATSNGTFFGVIKGISRPFREPGLDIYDYIFLADKDKEKLKASYPKLPVFDGNPERLRVESTAQVGSDAIDVPAGAVLKNLTGVMHYSFRTYTIFTDAAPRPAVSDPARPAIMPAPTDRQFTVAGMNLENFFDDQDDPAIKEDVLTAEAFQRRLKKISAAIRGVMQSPDIIGTVEVENLSALKRLAEKINADTAAAGKPDPKYDAYLAEGNDGRGIDVGFLVKTSRVKVLETKQLGKDEKYKNPNTGEENFLNDRPPLMVRVAVSDPKSGKPFELTVIVNHLKSFLGYNDPKQQDNVRLKKRLQAEFLAKFVQSRQKADPAEKILLLGDFNAFQFNDGIVDVIGTIKGTPASKDSVLNPSDDLVDPDMNDLVDMIKPDQRYSYSFDGSAQVLDHMIFTQTLKGNVIGFGYARVNADFPEAWRGDDTRLERFSDHDPAIAYFSFDEKQKAAQQ
jgi:predicted extracellular nuclease